MIQAILVFLVVAVSDILWAVYIKAVAQDKAMRAGMFSAIIVLCGSFMIISYTENNWMIIPAIIGAFVGTVIGVLFKRRKER